MHGGGGGTGNVAAAAALGHDPREAECYTHDTQENGWFCGSVGVVVLVVAVVAVTLYKYKMSGLCYLVLDSTASQDLPHHSVSVSDEVKIISRLANPSKHIPARNGGKRLKNKIKILKK